MVELAPETPASAAPRTARCELVEELVAAEQVAPRAALSATFPSFRCAADHPLDRPLAAIRERLADRTRAHFEAFVASVHDRPLDAGTVYLDRHCRTDTATTEVVSVVCTDTRSGFAGPDRSAVDSLTVLLSPGSATPVRALDLIRLDARPALLDLVARALRDADATHYLGREGPAPADATEVFTITEEGLAFHFAEGAVGAVAEGSYVATLGWSEVRPMLREDLARGPLRRLLRPPTCEAVQGLCQDRCQDGFIPATGRCDEGVCCVPDTSALPL